MTFAIVGFDVVFDYFFVVGFLGFKCNFIAFFQVSFDFFEGAGLCSLEGIEFIIISFFFFLQ